MVKAYRDLQQELFKRAKSKDSTLEQTNAYWYVADQLDDEIEYWEERVKENE
jgi:hypothetical protein